MNAQTPRTSTFFLIIAACALALGCDAQRSDAQRTIWSAEVYSSDRSSVASARTVQYSGPGNDGMYTTVYLKRTIYSNPPKEILLFDENNVTQSDAAKLDLVMKWQTPSHLAITYNGQVAALDFQVAKYAGIDISVSTKEHAK